MQHTNAVSFCEILHVLQDDKNQNEHILTAICDKACLDTVDRIYLGSNFCCRYFIRYIFDALRKATDLLRLQSFSHIKITLCVPIFSQTYLEKGKEIISQIVQEYHDYVDEITVNDYGMLDYVSGLGNVKVNVGRLLNKDTRDIRHDDYFNVSHVPAVSTLTNAVAQNYNVNLYELDLTHRFVDLSDSNLSFALYYPYCYATVGNVCEFASLHSPVQKKFRPNAPCDYACTNTSIDYENSRGDKYLKLGRTVYFCVDDFTVNSTKPYRLVYEPFDMFKPGELNNE